MTPFNPENKETLTYGECLRPAMEITAPEDARQYFAAYVAYVERALAKEPRSDGMTAETIAKANLGYFAGYYDHETRARVELLFNCSHPVFGKISKHGPPTAEQAFSAGLAVARERSS